MFPYFSLIITYFITFKTREKIQTDYFYQKLDINDIFHILPNNKQNFLNHISDDQHSHYWELIKLLFI